MFVVGVDFDDLYRKEGLGLKLNGLRIIFGRV